MGQAPQQLLKFVATFLAQTVPLMPSADNAELARSATRPPSSSALSRCSNSGSVTIVSINAVHTGRSSGSSI